MLLKLTFATILLALASLDAPADVRPLPGTAKLEYIHSIVIGFDYCWKRSTLA